VSKINKIKSAIIKTQIIELVNQHNEGMNITKIAKQLKSSKSTISKYVNEIGDNSDIFPMPFGEKIICFPNNYEGVVNYIHMCVVDTKNAMLKSKYLKEFKYPYSDDDLLIMIKNTFPKKEKYTKEDINQFVEENKSLFPNS
jgi:hypothetical protein